MTTVSAQVYVIVEFSVAERCGSEAPNRTQVSARRCMAKRIKSVDSKPIIGVHAETPLRLASGLFRRANQTPSNVPRPVATTNDDGRASRERRAARTCAKLSRDPRFACASRYSAAMTSDRIEDAFMSYPTGSAALQVAAGWREKADPGSSLRKQTGRSPPPANSPVK